MLRTVSYTVPSKKLTAPVTIAHLSDLHGFCSGPTPEALLSAVRKGRPDLIVMTGDMTDSRNMDFVPFLKLCRSLAKTAPVYFIPGNHEQALERRIYRRLLSEINASGAAVLENSRQYLSLKGQSLAVCGLTTPLHTYREWIREKLLRLEVKDSYLADVLGPCPDSAFTLLLYHNPLRFPVCARWGADLTLSGHIHGGIIRIPLLGGLLSPDVTFFPVYDGGHYAMGNRHLIVSRGLGNNFLRRINNPPELGFITLLPDHKL